ncbi:D-TA family PLP-dependent enzyme [Cucumibacter marinus]|uniref:D-TA family PLP-dependent enzyme n=1 Tax=Cucumibacter marinus TaxID=1121252 RepID=UPI000426E8C1|nr:D-TA family PLP-dependent enzyme [Cucumibacter marinus]
MTRFPDIAPGQRIETLPTPIPVIDEAVMQANIERVQAYMRQHGIAFRPHIKTHKLASVARRQLEAGAVGINCQKISEARVFADAGFADILITYNIVGEGKLDALKALHADVPRLSVTADSAATIEGLANTFSAERPLTVLVECDTGGGRCGVQSPEDAVALAKTIFQAPGLAFGGLMTYPAPRSEERTEAFFAAAKGALDGAGIPCPVITNGGTPSLFSAHLVPTATEHRAGTYVYNDRAMMRAGHCTLEDCAMRILATVVSRPTPERAVIDAGSKALTSDLLGFEDHGLLPDLPEARITGLSEEHGVIDLGPHAGDRPAVGDRVSIVPNHTCVVTNLFDFMVFHRDGVVTRVEPILARGQVW